MIPHERSLVKRLEGKPFALIGVNTDDDREMVKTRSKKDQVTWRSFYDGRHQISQSWNIQGFPTIVLIDHKGIIRGITHSGKEMEAIIDKLLKEMESTPQ